jgi:predicted HTH transcriptional regulator
VQKKAMDFIETHGKFPNFMPSFQQQKAIELARKTGKLTNKDYRRLFPGITDRTALNDLKDMVKKGLLSKSGKTKSACYTIPK